MENISELTPKQYEKWYWKDYNKICLTCINKCKQSHIATLVKCPQFVKEVKEVQEAIE